MNNRISPFTAAAKRCVIPKQLGRCLLRPTVCAFWRLSGFILLFMGLSSATADSPAAAVRLDAEQIEHLLETTPAPVVDFVDEFSLKQYLDLLGIEIESTTGKALMIVPDTAELELENVNSLDDVILQPLTFRDSASSVQTQFDFVLSQTVDPELAIIAKDDHLIVTTLAKMESTLFTRTYAVLDLIKRESLPIAGPKRRSELERRLYHLMHEVRAHAGPRLCWSDVDPDIGGYLSILNGRLVVSQTVAGHRNIRDFLEIMREDVAVPPQAPGSDPLASIAVRSEGPEGHKNEITDLHVLAITGWCLATLFATFSVILLLQLRNSLANRSRPSDSDQAQ